MCCYMLAHVTMMLLLIFMPSITVNLTLYYVWEKLVVLHAKNHYLFHPCYIHVINMQKPSLNWKPVQPLLYYLFLAFLAVMFHQYCHPNLKYLSMTLFLPLFLLGVIKEVYFYCIVFSILFWFDPTISVLFL